MKKSLKKNNKGFTLVELIVVVLIMAILSVALAPQVMKWVNNSRKSADVAAYNALYSGIELALADEDVYNAIKGGADITITMSSGVIAFSPAVASGNSSEALDNKLMTILDDNYKANVKSKVTSGSYTIKIDSGNVTVSKGTTPSDSMD